MFHFFCRLAFVDPYNFELYRFKLGAFFLRHSVLQQHSRLVVNLLRTC